MSGPIPFARKSVLGQPPDEIAALREEVQKLRSEMRDLVFRVKAGEIVRIVDGRIQHHSGEFKTLRDDAVKALGALMNECERLRGPINQAVSTPNKER